MHYPAHLQKIIEHFKKLPGVGSKSAERFAFQILTWDKGQLSDMARSFHTLHDNLMRCPECGCLADAGSCAFCSEEREEAGTLCVLANPKDVFAIEKTGEYRGLYHVLGGLLSPMEGFGPEQLSIGKLIERLRKHQISELIIAIDSTLEGDATALFLKRELQLQLKLQPFNLNITRLAFGIPMGSSLDLVDGGTLARALMGRDRV